MARLFEYLLQHQGVLKRLFFAILILVPLTNFGVERPETHFFGDTLPVFWSLFGLVVCLVMIVVCKWLAHVWLERDEGYYDS